MSHNISIQFDKIWFLDIIENIICVITLIIVDVIWEYGITKWKYILKTNKTVFFSAKFFQRQMPIYFIIYATNVRDVCHFNI